MKKFFLVLFLAFGLVVFSQSRQFLAFQTGFFADSYNSLGVRFFMEFQRDWNSQRGYGISLERTRFFGHYMTDYYPGVDADWTLFDYNYYYKLNLWKNFLALKLGAGVGISHLAWNNNDKLGPNFNFSFTLNVRIGQNVYLETTPIPILVPFSRFYFHFLPTQQGNKMIYSGTFHAIGIKIKI